MNTSKFLLVLLLTTATARAAEPPAAPATQNPDVVDVEKIKSKYWAKGDEAELGVVQNRLYSNAKHIELQGYGGIVASDPFLSVKNAGAALGYHLNNHFALHATYWRSFAGPSAALKTFESELKSTTNTNEPKGFFGLQASGGFMYGKLSLLGKSIIYFDLFLRGGVGETVTETGNWITPFLGLGQQIHLSKVISLLLDYKYMRYEEDIRGKVPGTANFGKILGTRVNTTDVVTLGVAFAIDPGFGG